MNKDKDDDKQFEESVHKLFDSIEKEFPGVAEGMRALNMSYTEYLAILQSSQTPTSFASNGTVMAIEK
jgi:hypothetical protein